MEIETSELELTKLHRDLISHTKKLGYFLTERNSSDGKAFDELVLMGYAEFKPAPDWMCADATYILTPKARSV